MAAPGRTPAIIIAALILVFGIIHLGVGSGIVGRYHQFDDIFQQPVGLAGFNIVIGIYGIAIGLVGLVAVIYENAALGSYPDPHFYARAERQFCLCKERAWRWLSVFWVFLR